MKSRSSEAAMRYEKKFSPTADTAIDEAAAPLRHMLGVVVHATAHPAFPTDGSFTFKFTITKRKPRDTLFAFDFATQIGSNSDLRNLLVDRMNTPPETVTPSTGVH
jgi:hypothetical protein